jgi:hypothetical protein
VRGPRPHHGPEGGQLVTSTLEDLRRDIDGLLVQGAGDRREVTAQRDAQRPHIVEQVADLLVDLLTDGFELIGPGRRATVSPPPRPSRHDVASRFHIRTVGRPLLGRDFGARTRSPAPTGDRDRSSRAAAAIIGCRASATKG